MSDRDYDGLVKRLDVFANDLGIELVAEAAAAILELQAERDRLRVALGEVTQALAWQCFGECRGYSENLMPPSEAVVLASAALATPPKSGT